MACKSSIKNEKIKPSSKDISEFVYASVKIEPMRSFQCKSSKTGIIKEIHIKEGETVKSDQLLFTLRHTADVKNRIQSAEINLKDAKDNLSGNNSSLKNIEIEIERIKEQYQLDSIYYHKQLKLWSQGIGSKNDLDQKKMNFQNSKSQLNTQRVNYSRTKSIIESKYELAESRLSLEKELTNDFMIKSEIDGTVFKIFKEEGELITPQEIFAEVGTIESYHIIMNIDEVDIPKIVLKDTALIKLEAYPDTTYTSLLSSISKSKDNNTQTFEVTADFITKPNRLFNGLSGEANILIDRRKDAIIIPAEYIIENNKVLTEDGLTTVTLGVKTLEFVEVKNGIDTSTILLKPKTK